MKISPPLFMFGLLGFLALLFFGLMSKIWSENKPVPQTPREVYLSHKFEMEKSPEMRQMELEDKAQERDGGDIGGPQDNRGYSDY
jgi:hypothetical protein